MTIKSAKHIKINSVNALYLIFDKVNWYFEEINENKYLAKISTNGSKEEIKSIKNCGVIKDLNRLTLKKSSDYDKKNMKIKTNLDN